jgi:hypothetical protein
VYLPFRDIKCPDNICIGIDRIENHTVKDKVVIPLKYNNPGISPDTNASGHIAVYNQPASIPFALTGDPSEFPFDHYSLNLRLVIPYNPQKAEFSNLLDESVKSNLDPPAFDNQSLQGNVACERANQSSYCDLTKRDTIYPKPSLWLIHYDFKRNYTVATITVPMLAIFYLLGAIFILESTMDQLTIRLAITLGIFVFLFTFTPIINQMKPPSTVPTVADSLVILILFATIAFSVSSVISGSPVIRNKFPQGSIWIDRIVFLVVSAIIVWYFAVYKYSPEITIWIVPVIVFGLGYGLLLRTSGLKITRHVGKRI